MSTSVTALPRAPFDLAVRSVNEWRGRCLDVFSRAELSVTECLLTMSQDTKQGGSIKLPHLVGQRYEALTTATTAGGPFASRGENLHAAIEHFRAHDRLRTMLTHGVGEITLNAQGRWTLVLRLVSLRSRRSVRDMIAIRENEAEVIRANLARDSRSLCSHIGLVTSKLLDQ